MSQNTGAGFKFEKHQRSAEEQIASLSPQHRRAFNELAEWWSRQRSQLNGGDKVHYDDYMLLRFLRASPGDKKFNVVTARPKLVAYAKWSREQQLHNLKAELLRSQLETGVVSIPGNVTADGHPILYIQASCFFPGRRGNSLQELFRSIVYLLNNLTMNEGAATNGIALMANLQGWGAKNFSFALARRFFTTFQGGYPVRVRQFLLVDAPWVFPQFWKLVGPLMSRDFSSKVQFVSSSRSAKNPLHHYLNLPSQVPQSMGGDLNVERQLADYIQHRILVESEMQPQNASGVSVDDQLEVGPTSSSPRRESSGGQLPQTAFSRRRMQTRKVSPQSEGAAPIAGGVEHGGGGGDVAAEQTWFEASSPSAMSGCAERGASASGIPDRPQVDEAGMLGTARKTQAKVDDDDDDEEEEEEEEEGEREVYLSFGEDGVLVEQDRAMGAVQTWKLTGAAEPETSEDLTEGVSESEAVRWDVQGALLTGKGGEGGEEGGNGCPARELAANTEHKGDARELHGGVVQRQGVLWSASTEDTGEVNRVDAHELDLCVVTESAEETGDGELEGGGVNVVRAETEEDGARGEEEQEEEEEEQEEEEVEEVEVVKEEEEEDGHSLVQEGNVSLVQASPSWLSGRWTLSHLLPSILPQHRRAHFCQELTPATPVSGGGQVKSFRGTAEGEDGMSTFERGGGGGRGGAGGGRGGGRGGGGVERERARRLAEQLLSVVEEVRAEVMGWEESEKRISHGVVGPVSEEGGGGEGEQEEQCDGRGVCSDGAAANAISLFRGGKSRGATESDVGRGPSVQCERAEGRAHVRVQAKSEAGADQQLDEASGPAVQLEGTVDASDTRGVAQTPGEGPQANLNGVQLQVDSDALTPAGGGGRVPVQRDGEPCHGGRGGGGCGLQLRACLRSCVPARRRPGPLTGSDETLPSN